MARVAPPSPVVAAVRPYPDGVAVAGLAAAAATAAAFPAAVPTPPGPAP